MILSDVTKFFLEISSSIEVRARIENKKEIKFGVRTYLDHHIDSLKCDRLDRLSNFKRSSFHLIIMPPNALLAMDWMLASNFRASMRCLCSPFLF